MKNMFSETIQSARGTAFLSDGQNPVISQSTKWVVGGNPKLPGLSPGATTTFNFVIPIIKLVASTNLQSKVTFNRLVLEGGKLVDPSKNIEMEK
jgi:hypothetical protein